MSPLRQHVITQSKPFKCSLEGGNVHVIVDFAQGYQGCGAERYDTGEIYVGEYMAGERYGREPSSTRTGRRWSRGGRTTAPWERECSGLPITKRRRG